MIGPVDPDASEAIMRTAAADVNLLICRKQMYSRRSTILRDRVPILNDACRFRFWFRELNPVLTYTEPPAKSSPGEALSSVGGDHEGHEDS